MFVSGAVRSLSALALCLACGQSSASLVVNGSGSGFGSPGLKSASAEFDLSGNNLVVKLTNTGTEDVLVPADVLTAVFFDISGPALSLGRVSGLLTAGSSVYYDPDGQPAGGVIGGEWAYKGGLADVGPITGSYGISSTGIGLFGPGDRFPGPDLSAPTSPDGLQYGILSAGDDTSTGNNGVLNSGGLIKNSVTMTLSGLPVGFSLNQIGNVYFLYGTATDEGGFYAPAPGALALLGLAGMTVARRNRR